MNRKTHWDQVYQRTSPELVSWYQPEPTLSLRMIRSAVPDISAAIVDVGGAGVYVAFAASVGAPAEEGSGIRAA